MTKKMDKELFFSKTREYLDNYLTVQRGKSPQVLVLPVDKYTIEKMTNEILSIDIEDNVTFSI